MVQPRSRRLRLLESLRRTINEMLHERVRRAANEKGHGAPLHTATIYSSATRDAPELLDQLLFVHQKVDLERGETNAATPPSELADRDKKAMLSAVRAAVNRTRASLDQ